VCRRARKPLLLQQVSGLRNLNSQFLQLSVLSSQSKDLEPFLLIAVLEGAGGRVRGVSGGVATTVEMGRTQFEVS
jgi:hypothetical protein